MGYTMVPEAAISVIEDLNTELGVEGQKLWRKQNQTTFQERLALRQKQLEEAAPQEARVVFYDRGRLDGHAYSRHFGESVTKVVNDIAVGGPRYDRVLVL